LRLQFFIFYGCLFKKWAAIIIDILNSNFKVIALKGQHTLAQWQRLGYILRRITYFFYAFFAKKVNPILRRMDVK